MKCPKCESKPIGYSAMMDYDKPWHYDGVIAWHCKACDYWWPIAEIKEWIEFCKEMNDE